MAEFDLIDHIRQRVVGDPAGSLGIGDDCCIWHPGGTSCLSVDGIVEGRHFDPDTEPECVGRKAAGAALSDLAAMGARPVGAVVSLHLPARWDGVRLMDGLIAGLERHGCHCFGGDTTGAEQLVVSVTVWGEPMEGGRLVPRSGARAGDLVVVTGRLGGSLRSGRHLRPEPRFPEGQWLARQSTVTAMMDLSDGLAGDAPKLAAASGCGVILLPDQVPVHADCDHHADVYAQAFQDGEDFELLCTVDPAAWPEMQLAWPFETPLSSVGWIVQEPGSWIEDRSGRLVGSPYRGFSH